MTDAEEQCRFFIDVWAEEVRRLARSVQTIREKHAQDLRAAEYGEDWSPTDHDLYERFGRLWAAQHHLIWAAHQLERWVARLTRDRGEPPPVPDPVLADLRNALEHLDEAVLDGSSASAGTDSKANRSLRRLPGSRLLIGTAGSSLLFEIVDPAEIERRALSIATTSDELMAEAEWLAADLVHRYFEGRQDDDRTPLYTGAAFERLSGGGDHPDVANLFTADDLVAVSMLSVQVPPRAAIRILQDDADRLSAYLADVPADVDLADADESVISDGSAADRLRWQLYGYPGIGSVTAGKLLARKRPRLIPVFDGVISGVLGHPGKGYWQDLRGELRADDGRLVERLNEIRSATSLGDSVSTIRVFDVLVWMIGKGALWRAPLRRSEPELLF
jgi:Family of unknown function (DUF6308)